MIHSYHQTKVADKAPYGKAFGKALLIVAAAPLLSGIIGLFGGSDKRIALVAIATLIIILGIGIGFIIAVQNKYNNGVF